MSRKPVKKELPRGDELYKRIREILESARTNVSRTVNTTQVVANWLVRREIVEEEQDGQWRAAYGKEVLRDVSGRLRDEYGSGYSVDNLELFRRFYREYPALISEALPRNLKADKKSEAARRKSYALHAQLLPEIPYASHKESWEPSWLHPNLSWTHYRILLRVDKSEARAFYEIEALKNNWSARELERLAGKRISS